MPRLRNDQSRYIDNLLNKIGENDGSGINAKHTSLQEQVAKDTNKSYLTEIAEANKNMLSKQVFISNCRDTFLAECLNRIYSGVLNRVMNEKVDASKARSLVSMYVAENGSFKLLDRMQDTELLESMALLVEKATDEVTDACKDGTCDGENIPTDIKDSFYDELDMDDVDDVMFQIADRVNDAIDDFVNTNTLYKLNIKEILSDSQEKLKTAKTDAQAESVQRIAGNAIHDIRNKGYIGYFTEMVESSTKSVLANPVLREAFMEGTELDMARIVNNCKMSYAFMEMVNSINLELFNEDKMFEQLNAIKA